MRPRKIFIGNFTLTQFYDGEMLLVNEKVDRTIKVGSKLETKLQELWEEISTQGD